MNRQPIHTDLAPAAIGNYSQAIRCGSTVYLSGQLPIDPKTQKANTASVEDEIRQVFSNLRAVAKAGSGMIGALSIRPYGRVALYGLLVQSSTMMASASIRQPCGRLAMPTAARAG